MIFVTVGHQMPFDRLIRAVDGWAERQGRNDVIAQVGDSAFRPVRIQVIRSMSTDEFRCKVQQAEAVVAHAGTGTILTAMELGKPILVMPRLAHLRETRNDHQVATAHRFRELGRVSVAEDETLLPAALDRLSELSGGPKISSEASAELISALREFIHSVACRS